MSALESLDTAMNMLRRLQRMYDKRFCKISGHYAFGIWGLTIHLILLWGVLDVNFHSPIIQGLPSVPAPKGAPAKRLVLFVADGLRFRTFIEAPPKYLKEVMVSKGVWGISHTRMPTESRPGVIAICAGLYEDPSALFKGWKENPVDFDSVFNQSRYTWAWGSPDIIPIFTKDTKGNVYGNSYPHEWEDFDIIRGQIWRLDSWVFDKFTDWLGHEGYKIKDQDGIILFLHLLGCDTTGHTAKPHSREYTDNMNYVDRRIKEIVQTTENFFGNDSTAYVFTADHGMTDWGSHGSGSTDETETPVVVWGAGTNSIHTRQDIEQVDITPLISSLVGIPIPVNNEGVLPLQYLSPAYRKYGGYALLNNLKQLRHQVKANRAMNCEDDSNRVHSREIELDKKIMRIEYYYNTERVEEGIRECQEALKLAKDSLAFFRQYQRSRFLIYLSTMWIGWIAFLFFKITGVRRSVVKSSSLLLANVGFVALLIILFVRHIDCNSWRLPSYASLAILSLWLAVRSAIIYSPKLTIKGNVKSWIEITGTIFLLTTMFAGLTYRFVLSLGMLCAMVLQTILLKNSRRLLLWTALALAIFPLLPVVEPHPRVYIVLISIAVVTLIAILKDHSWYWKAMEILRLTITALVCAEFVDGRSWVSWLILITTPICICTYSTNLKERMRGIALSLFCPLALLSASYEPFFFVVLAVHFLCWPQFETAILQSRVRGLLTTEEILKAAYFMLYTLLCFFGTGNMASISSFDPSWTRHFVTVFSPFVMFFLILLKISIPLLLVGCTSHTLGSSTVFLAVLLLGDCLSLPLMYNVTPHGSWLDIGSAISRFTIAITLPCLLLLLHYLSYPLMTFRPKNWRFRALAERKHGV